MKKLTMTLLFISQIGLAQEAPMGNPVIPSPDETQKLSSLAGKVHGKIVWSTSRSNPKHDLWIMNADGTDAKQLTKGDEVDWFSRFSPDGSRVLFTRSKAGWVSENDAEYPEKWDLWTVPTVGGEPTKIAENATWGTWRPDGKSIVFSRRNKVILKNLIDSTEKILWDGTKTFGDGVVVQEPNLSPDGKYIAATLRGTKRETGIWDLEKQVWVNTGDGCQIDWFPSGDRFYRMNPTGNGGTAAPSEVLSFHFKNGLPVEKVGVFGVPNEVKLMDLPGRRSHEYFPKVDQLKGEWLVWGATDKGHDHDLVDYEIYIWKIGTPKDQAVRLTFHTGNDRWPDLWLNPSN